MRTQARLALALLLPALALACGGATVSAGGGSSSSSGDGGHGSGSGSGPGDCALLQILPPVLTITNASTGAAVCNAVLVNNDAGSASIYDCSGQAGCTSTCPYTVMSETGGYGTPFTITVSAPGFASVTVPNLVVNTCGCESDCGGPQEVAVKLPPEPGQDGGGPVLPCPVTQPTGFGSCSIANALCEYGSDPNPDCNDVYECSGSMLFAQSNPGCPDPTSACPTSYGSATGSCSTSQQTCAYAQGTCLCTTDPGGLPIEGGPVWSCTPTTAGCPAARPDLGTPCSTSPSLNCDYGQCSGGVAESCQDGYWQYATGTACPA